MCTRTGKTGLHIWQLQFGKGTYVYANGFTYDGNFVNGVREGRGILKGSDGSSYDGMWVKDKFQGQGTYIWPDGSKYMGAWEHGVQNGYGIFFYPNGDKYTGYLQRQSFRRTRENIRGRTEQWRRGCMMKGGAEEVKN